MENLRHFVVGAVAVALMLWPRAGAALSFVIPEPYLNSFHFVVRFIDTSPAGMGVILERVHGPIRVYTVPPAPEVDFEMSDIGPVGYGGIGDPALWDPQMQLLTSGTPYLFEGEIPGFGCLRGKGISGLRYRDQDYPHRVNYNLLPYLMIPVDARQLGRQHFRRPISSSSWMEDEAAMVVVSAFLADSLTTPSYGLSVKALSHEDRDRGYLLEVFDSEDNLLASREVEWFIYESFQFDTVIFSRHVSASIFFGTVNDLEDLQSQSPYSERWLFVPGDIPEGPVTIRRTVPG